MTAQNSTQSDLIFRLLLKITVGWVYYVLLSIYLGGTRAFYFKTKNTAHF